MNKEMLAVIESVSNEKSIAKTQIFSVLEAALAAAIKRKSAQEIDIRVSVDHKDGTASVYRRWLVVDAVTAPLKEITLEAARLDFPNCKVGEYIEDLQPDVQFDRIMSQTAKQVIFQKVREIEKQQLIDHFRNYLGTIVTGIVRKVTREYLLVDIGQQVEAILSRERMLPKELYRVGDRIRAILKLEHSSTRGDQLILDRIDDEMLKQLIRIEVPEIAEGLIEVKAVAREPGIRSKLAIYGRDKRLDPIGACIGMRGARIQAVSNELFGEKIDLVLWDENIAAFVINAMSPAEVLSIVVEEDSKEIAIAVEEASLPQAIGRHGQNVRLASKLTGWSLHVMTQEELQKKYEQEAHLAATLFQKHLSLSADYAQQLVNAGFTTLEELAYVPVKELVDGAGLTEEQADQLRQLARHALLVLEERSSIPEQTDNQMIEEVSDLLQLPLISPELAEELKKHHINTLEQLAEQSSEELADLKLLPTAEERGALIMAARKLCWFNE